MNTKKEFKEGIKMFEINKKDKIIEIKYGEQKIEYPIEETQKLIDDLPYKYEYKKLNILDKSISLIHNPLISIPGRVVWLFGRFFIAVLANYGAYSAYVFMSTNTYSINEIESAKIVMYSLQNAGIIITLYILYDIVSTLIRLYFVIRHEIRKLK